MTSEDEQRADDLERMLDEGGIARAAPKMVKKWPKAHAEVAIAEVARRNSAHRKDTIDSAAVATAVDESAFSRRDEELELLRTLLED
jgi:hypothetical protein